jgi:hypothetical protein
LEPSAELIAQGVGNTIGFVLGTSGSYTFSFTLYIAGSYKVKVTETSEGGGSSVPELDIYLTVVGRGLHSSTSQLNLSRFGHTSSCPPV